LGKSKYVTVWQVNPLEDWRDYFMILKKPYNILSKSGLRIKLNHIFTAFSEPANNFPRFFTRVSDLPDHERVFGDVLNSDFVPPEGNRLEALRSLQPEKVLYKGLPGYKQVLMHEKYIPFVPRQYRSDDLYKKPEAVLMSEKEDQNKRKKYKKMKKNFKNASHILSRCGGGPTSLPIETTWT
jgi:hypothetical protein